MAPLLPLPPAMGNLYGALPTDKSFVAAPTLRQLVAHRQHRAAIA
jgi:hypothetical protein